MRRIVSHASTITNFEKINIIKRVLTGLSAAGGRWVVYMPDPKDLVGKAYHSLRNTSDMEVNPVNIPVNGNELDTVLAAEKMSKMGVAAIITIGGDGTNRLVVKQAIDVPLIPISTGTNNIFPDFIEGTRAGFAAGISLFSIAGEIDKKKLCIQNKLIRAECDGWYENALIDLAISNSEHIGGRALWNPDSLSHIFVTQASAGAIGLSGIVGAIMEIGQNDPHCAYLKMGRTKFVKAILAPGFVGKVGIHSVEKIDLNFKKTIYIKQGSLWADGDKVKVIKDDYITVSVTKDGPLLLNISAVLSLAAEKSLFYFHE